MLVGAEGNNEADLRTAAATPLFSFSLRSFMVCVPKDSQEGPRLGLNHNRFAFAYPAPKAFV